MKKEILFVDNLRCSKFNNETQKFIEFKLKDDYYLININTIKSIKQSIFSSIDEDEIWEVKVHTDSNVFVIYTHNVQELDKFLLTGCELSFDYYCRDSQRMLRGLLKTNDEMIRLNDEALRVIDESKRIIFELNVD